MCMTSLDDLPVRDSVVEEVVKDLRDRSRVGESKYGANLDRNDLAPQEWIQHLKEELMDAVLYLTRLERESKINQSS